MEYHFTGTGASPDFTFIADAIVDSVGNRIFYSSIKKTKIKVKSNTAVLLITTVVEGVKSEHDYSIRKSDEEALKAAIAEIGLNVAVTKRPKLRIHFKKKTVVVLLVLTFGVLTMPTMRKYVPKRKMRSIQLLKLQNRMRWKMFLLN